ncbi:hypothetical protein GFK26_18390 [Variovorax paradoxus]|uniref:Uncharacterized protein n=1 Tax=Variovorax paradoxus TaxID=34073 RepID=A0A5Q0M5Y4_VARPD|nr:hypothetical protein [Variovorax paradoxus]QFZ84598.1 hypothetical protein GFK26_18390 [Variovorax paradoxus]
MANLSEMRRLMGDLGLFDPYGAKIADLRSAAGFGKDPWADQYLCKPNATASVTSTRSAAAKPVSMGEMEEALKKARDERARATKSAVTALYERKTASLVWMAQNHPDKLGRHAKANILDLKAGRLPQYRGAFQLDVELIECCHLANFRRDPEGPGNHSAYVNMVEGAVRNWDENCAEDLKLCAEGKHAETLTPEATARRRHAAREESEKIERGRQEAARLEKARLAAELRQKEEHELARKERAAREFAVRQAEQRQTDVDAVVDELLAEQAGGEW